MKFSQIFCLTSLELSRSLRTDAALTKPINIPALIISSSCTLLEKSLGSMAENSALLAKQFFPTSIWSHSYKVASGEKVRRTHKMPRLIGPQIN
jgi:hypothetical protein